MDKQSTTLDENLRLNLPGKTMWAIVGGIIVMTLFWANFSNKVDRVIERQNDEIAIRREMQQDLLKIKEDVYATKEDIAVIKGRLGLQASSSNPPVVLTSNPAQPQALRDVDPVYIELNHSSQATSNLQPTPTAQPNSPVAQIDVPSIPQIPTPIQDFLDIVIPIPTPIKSLLNLL